MDWRLVAVLLAVALAGCGSFADPPGGDGATEAETLTPAPVPSPTPTETATLPPGVTGDGVPNANALFGAHRSVLAGQSYTVAVRVQIDETVSTTHIRYESADRYHRHDVIGGYNQNVTVFVEDDVAYVRSVLWDDTEYFRGSDTDRLSTQTVRLATVFLRLEDATVAETLVDDELHYEVRASYPAHPRVESLENFTIRAVVSPEGLVRSMNASYTVRDGSSTTNISRSFRYTDVGSTEVERPDWVEEEWDDDHETGGRVSPRS